MNIVFRADSSTTLGGGHIMRCLVLAAALRARGADIRFVCRAHVGHLGDLIRAQGFTLSLLDVPCPEMALGCDWQTDAADTLAALSGPVDWLVVDHYGINRDWHQTLRAGCHHILVIDDLADRPFDCDLLLDQNHGRVPADYAPRTRVACEYLLGPRYALVRPQFAAQRERALARRSSGQVRRILVSMGNADADNVTAEILRQLDGAVWTDAPAIDIALGSQSPHVDAVSKLITASTLPINLRRAVDDMSGLMMAADLVISGGGSTVWERCVLGIPGIMLVLAPNQAYIARQVAGAGAGVVLERVEDLPDCVGQLLQDPVRMRAMSVAASSLCAGDGADRVTNVLLRPAWREGGKEIPT